MAIHQLFCKIQINTFYTAYTISNLTTNVLATMINFLDSKGYIAARKHSRVVCMALVMNIKLDIKIIRCKFSTRFNVMLISIDTKMILVCHIHIHKQIFIYIMSYCHIDTKLTS